LVLLDTGSSTSIRQTAAKQLAELAAKSVTGDVQIEEDVKNVRSEVPRADIAAWTELMSVVGRVSVHRFCSCAPVTQAQQILPFLHSKSHETRTAASTALSNICSLVPIWRPLLQHPLKSDEDIKMEDATTTAHPLRPAPEFPQFSVQELLQKGTLLLSSSGKEFVKPANLLANPAEVKKARKAAMSRLGLDFLDAVADDDDGMDWEKELADEPEVDVALAPMADIKVEQDNGLVAPMPITAGSSNTTSARPTSASIPSSSSTPAPTGDMQIEEDLAGMSARERNRLKRKRKAGGSAFVAAAPPPSTSNSKYTASLNASGSK
jgi:TATA-binding protein-associated factor